jgi:hypothetical protein
MNDLRTVPVELLRQALEALEDLGMKHCEITGEVLHKEAYAALRAALEQPEPPPKPLHWDKIRAEFLDINRHTLPGDMTLEDWFRAGVRYAEREHEIV